MSKPQPTPENLAKAVGDIQNWLHDTRGYHPDPATDFRGGAGELPGGGGTTINLNLAGLVEALEPLLKLVIGIDQKADNIMSAISDFNAKVSASFDKLGTAVDGVVADVAFLKDQIAKLQNSPGTITPEDQATLDALQARADALSAKVSDLDAATDSSAVPTPTPAP